jgi:radical SAM superfamily enzyme YgiQ (UPF0313 family)
VCASRGCSFDCSFCTIRRVYRDFQKKDPKIVVDDILSQVKNQHPLSRFFPRGIWIVDDNFFNDRQWAKQVLQGLSRIQTNHVLVLQARVDIADDDEMLEVMKGSGVNRIYLGVESINPISLENFGKSYGGGDIGKAIKKIKSFGIEVHGLFVFGDEEFVKGDGLRVANFVKQHGLSGLLIQPLTPFPGTKTYSKLKRENRLLHEKWHEYNGKVVFRPKKLSPAELQEEICTCYKGVYSPLELLKSLLFGKRGFKMGNLGEGIIRHVEAAKMRNYIRDNL